MKRTNLEVVQLISKVLGIISKIVMTISIIGVVLCVVGTVMFSIGAIVDGEFLKDIEQSHGYTASQIIGGCLAGAVAALCEAIVARLCMNYFLMEQKAGTPFTADGAKALKSLGIANIVIPFIAVVVCSIIEVLTGCESANVEVGIATGIIMLLFSYVLGYGAELESAKRSSEN